ncbi:MAG TPA: hypothetical protein VN455_14005 [Methanotrichaceae archaeon]|nr:hypothetical protein [Methanotrichaceae archaeon]
MARAHLDLSLRIVEPAGQWTLRNIKGDIRQDPENPDRSKIDPARTWWLI